ncbi:MAG: hypothetical protein SAK29_00110 [Scytonema sp. PMC 1069.18]|nr:hypothetical protein [Scytonema sp. PMC 1069.18]MEC4879971.1 hypothetical protein [Scytonema sp. PMC 1070.18]
MTKFVRNPLLTKNETVLDIGVEIKYACPESVGRGAPAVRPYIFVGDVSCSRLQQACGTDCCKGVLNREPTGTSVRPYRCTSFTC